MNAKSIAGSQTEPYFDFKILPPKSKQPLCFKLVTECSIGSDTTSDIVISDHSVEGKHVRVFVSPSGDVFIESSSEGTSVALNGKVQNNPTVIQDGDWIVLGSTPYQVFLQPIMHTIPSNELDISKNSTHTFDLKNKSAATIGRSVQCDIVVDSPLVSRLHARLVNTPVGWVIEDNESTNGTFVNTYRIQGQWALTQGDRISIAASEYCFIDNQFELSEQAGKIAIQVEKLTKFVADNQTQQRKYLLRDVSFTVEPGEFVGIFGTSGSGKSTLLDALNGRRPASEGSVLYNGINLYEAFDLFRTTIGYVPQQDIVHRNIVMQHALKYTARLRLPSDMTDPEMEDNAAEVLNKVALSEKARLLVNTPAPLSGGQLKRVSLAVELVSNPDILFLDEVTSGLDAGTDKKMMTLFRDLAVEGKTVVCITHTLENIDACHLVVLLHQGRLVFFGPPQAVVGYFNIDRLSDVYEVLESKTADYWAEHYRQSSFYQRYVKMRAAVIKKTPADHQAGKVKTGARYFPSWRQTFTLMDRYFELLLSDKRNLLFLIAQAPLIALIIGLVFTIDENLAARALTENQIVFILSLSVIWFGCINSVRELVKELPIYLRERSVNLGIFPYIFSKLIPLTLICFIQCLLLLAMLAVLFPIEGNLLLRFAVLFMLAVAATAMGLAVSAFVGSNDKAMTAIPSLLVPQIILAGAIVKLDGTALWIAKLTTVSYWGFEAIKNTLSEPVKSVKHSLTGEQILIINYSTSEGLLAIAALTALFLMITLIGLKLKDRVN